MNNPGTHITTVCFICGSIEIGKNGVGDYTRALAATLHDRGILASIIAINDRHATVPTYEKQAYAGVVVPTLRIPATTSNSERFSILRDALPDKAGTIISLQYVPYSFSSVGLPISFTRNFPRIVQGYPCHIMFHEMWLNEPFHEQVLKNRSIAQLQKWLIIWLIKQLDVVAVHTHVPKYFGQLKHLLPKVAPLPLFSNISPVTAKMVRHQSEEVTGEFRVVLFSQIKPRPAIGTELAAIERWLATTGRSGTVTLVGGGDNKRKQFVDSISHQLDRLRIIDKGFCSAEEVSTTLLNSDLALTPVPRHLIGKSGTVASFLAHQLPILAPFIQEDGPGFLDAAYEETVITKFEVNAYQKARSVAAQIKPEQLSAESVVENMLRSF